MLVAVPAAAVPADAPPPPASGMAAGTATSNAIMDLAAGGPPYAPLIATAGVAGVRNIGTRSPEGTPLATSRQRAHSAARPHGAGRLETAETPHSALAAGDNPDEDDDDDDEEDDDDAAAVDAPPDDVRDDATCASGVSGFAALLTAASRRSMKNVASAIGTRASAATSLRSGGGWKRLRSKEVGGPTGRKPDHCPQYDRLRGMVKMACGLGR